MKIAAQVVYVSIDGVLVETDVDGYVSTASTDGTTVLRGLSASLTINVATIRVPHFHGARLHSHDVRPNGALGPPIFAKKENT